LRLKIRTGSTRRVIRKTGEVNASMKCYYCNRISEIVHSFTVYAKDGTEERFEVLCSDCHADWLLSLKG
jgi:hypothetical protein